MFCVVGFAAVRATEMKTGHAGAQKNSWKSIFFKWANEPVAKQMDECTGKVAGSGEGSLSSVFIHYLSIHLLRLGHNWRIVEDTGCLQTLSSLSFFLI